MSKGLIGLVVAAVVVIGILWAIGGQRGFVTADEAVIKEWANVETQYQRRADLIGNLVKTVQGSADFERSTLTDVIDARSKATSINIDPSNITPEQLQQFQAAQGQLSGALSRLLVTVERYPDLKANQNFLELQAQLEGTENRVAVARTRFNEVVQTYNVKVRQFPGSVLAGLFGYDRRANFEADAGSENAPDVNFSFE